MKRGVRLLRARSARTSHARRACEAREKKRIFSVSPQSRSLFSASFQTFYLTARVLEYAKIRTVLQSILTRLFIFSPQIETEAPVYIGIVRDYLTDVWNRLWPVVHKYLVIVWDFLSENVPLLLSKAQELLTTLASKVYELAPDFFSSVASWFAKLGEKIVEKLPDVLAVIQEYAVIAINLAVNLINSVLEWIQSMAGRYVVSLGSVMAFVLATLFPNSLSKKVLILRLAY